MILKQIEDGQSGIGNGHPGYQDEDSTRFGDEFHNTFKALAEELVRQWPHVKSILELGCGTGSLSTHLRAVKPDLFVVTTDGSLLAIEGPYLKDNPNHFVVQTDKKFTLVGEDGLPFQFDLIISYEHFEHLSHDNFDVVLDNIKRHSHSKTILHVTAANWSYGPHINVKSREQWVEYMTAKGFVLRSEAFVNSSNRPYNFEITRTSEMTFDVPGEDRLKLEAKTFGEAVRRTQI